MLLTTFISSFGISELFSLLIILTIIYVTQYYYHYFTRVNPLPGPFPLPFVGNVHQIIGHEYNNWLDLMHKKYGDMFEVNMTGQRIIILGRADLIENMSLPSAKTKYFIRRNSKGVDEYRLGIRGMSNSTVYENWKYNRQFFAQAMMTPSFNHQAVEWTIESWEEMESFWNNLGENRELDLSKWIYSFSNEMIFRISTGVTNNAVYYYYNSLIPENYSSLSEKEKEKIEDSGRFVQSVETFVSGMFYFMIFNKYVRNYAPFICGQVNYYVKNRDYLFDKVYNIIKQRRIEIENTPLDQPLRHDMLTSFITANTSRDISDTQQSDADLMKPMNDKEIFGNILDAMLGGTATMANLFCFIIYYLEHYPEVKQRLRQEFETVLGKDLTKPITFHDINELKYCDAVIKEVYRYFPVAFITDRVNTEQDMLGGYNWPIGTLFHMHYGAVMKHPNYWTDPEKFDPDRFYKFEEDDKYLLERQHIKNSFNMWGSGFRSCPGRKLAMIEMKCLLASIYRKYDVELVDMNAPIKYRSIFHTVCKELLVKIKPRKF